MKSNSEQPSDDNLPSFFLKDDKITQDISKKRNNYDKSFESSPKTDTHSSKLTIRIHWPSLAIGAGIAVACIISVMLMANVITYDETKVLDEILIKEDNTIKKQSVSILIDNASPPLGNENAPVTMVEFGDYQCTFCNKFFHETEGSIITNYVKTGKVKILFKDFIILGNDSLNAAVASHCANDQKMFWQYHSILYNNWDGEDTGWAAIEHLYEFANVLNLDMNEFSTCMSESKWQELVNLSNIDGNNAGVTGTPTFFVIDQSNNVIKITGAQHYDVFKEVFDSMLE
ncbi:putative disulfide bond formation protein D [Marine Group I thaumarchaeote SCGC AAA799-D07]|nr:putative disulfide bond formation protein D [Marine Group I thaumarchaeote SCGC AAA799-D07]